MSRTDLIAACVTASPDNAAWALAVTQLGRAARAGFPLPKKPGRPTGLTSGELIRRMTESHVFDADREAIRRRIPYASHSQIIDWLKIELETRKKAERATLQHA